VEAMTADGQTVPITFNPETGQYLTESGEPVIIQVADSEKKAVDPTTSMQPEAMEDDVAIAEISGSEDTSDLSSLALAAETHSSGHGSSDSSQIQILNSDGTMVSNVEAEQPQVRIINAQGQEVTTF
jgi:hypothetical protein